MSKTIKLGILVLMVALLAVFTSPALGKASYQKCMKGCAMSVEYCTKACTENSGGTPDAKAQCKKVCAQAKKKCEEMCQKRK